jgi:hypothetical protein
VAARELLQRRTVADAFHRDDDMCIHD